MFFFVQSKKYKFNQQLEPYAPETPTRMKYGRSNNHKYSDGGLDKVGMTGLTMLWPDEKIKAVQAAMEVGKAYGGLTSKWKVGEGGRDKDMDDWVRNGGYDKAPGRNKRCVWKLSHKNYKGAHFAVFPPDLIEPCILAGSPEGGVVLDMFIGSGTTAMVANKHGRSCVGIELNPEYIKLIEERLNDKSSSISSSETNNASTVETNPERQFGKVDDI